MSSVTRATLATFIVFAPGSATSQVPTPCPLVRFTFDDENHGWVICGGVSSVTSGGTVVAKDRRGGPKLYGCRIRSDDPDRPCPEMVISSPPELAGDLSRFVGGYLAFDLQLVDVAAAGPYRRVGNVTIFGGGAAACLDLIPGDPALGVWSTYSAPLTASAWGRSESDWRQILRDVTQIAINLEAGYGHQARETETVAFDNFVLSCNRPFVRGDANADGRVDLSDSIFVLSYLFLGGPEPLCLDAADANDDSEVIHDPIDISDAVYLLSGLFLGGRLPPSPFPSCGTDGTPGGLGCLSYPPCEA